jgi:hypothetical protein
MITGELGRFLLLPHHEMGLGQTLGLSLSVMRVSLPSVREGLNLDIRLVRPYTVGL